jgi:hypothetical protein
MRKALAFLLRISKQRMREIRLECTSNCELELGGGLLIRTMLWRVIR